MATCVAWGRFVIVVDDRGGNLGTEGARRRLNDLRDRGVDAELGRLEFGDYGFAGNGPDGDTVMVGVELKRTQDLLLSLRGKRLIGHQLPGMNGMYDFPWLLTEGIWREGSDGNFEHYQGTWTTASLGTRALKMRDVESWILSSITPFPKTKYWHTSTAKDTALFVTTLHRWWTEKEYDEHRSSQVIYLPAPERAMFTEPTGFVRMLVAGVEGLGWAKAHAIEHALGACPGKFTTLRGMSARDLQQIDGIGPVLAQRLISVLE